MTEFIYFFECGEICPLCNDFSWIFNSISSYSDPYYFWIFLLWLHVNYDAVACDRASLWYIVVFKKRILFVSFFTFHGNPSAIFPNYFDNKFCQRSHVFYFIRYFYCSMSSVYGSITNLTRYQGKVSSSMCVAMLCVAIGIVGAVWFISSCVTIGTLFVATLGVRPGVLFPCVYMDTSLGFNLGGLPGCICSGVSACTSLV